MKLTAAFLAVCGLMAAQTPDENTVRMAAGATPIFRASVTARTAKAINYQHRNGATKINFVGTSLLPDSRGEAKVESKQGYIEIEVEFDNLQPAPRLGAEYLTYVMWAISPEGRAVNLGEVLLNGTKSKLNVTTQLQVFGLIVTAEPYFAVSQPSDLVVMENMVRPDTKGKIEEIDAKYELLQRGHYEHLANPLALQMDRKMPLELYEARNAVQIARTVGAGRFAVETFQKAEKSLADAEAYQARNAGRKPVTMTAREAVQMAEDSRVIAVKRQESDALAAERQAAESRTARAEGGLAAAQSETDRVRMNAEAERIRALEASERLNRENARLASEKDAQAAAAAAEADRLKRETEARLAASDLEANRLRLENEAKLAAANAEADRLKRESESRLTAAELEADRLRRENADQKAEALKQQAAMEAERAQLRSQLLMQFNMILQTRDTARGLIVNMSDVLFDTGKYSLRQAAREKLAKVAGIVSGHPGLRLDIEGHTDSVGGDEYNQTLSEQRGAAVRDFLTSEGMPQSSVTSKGFGKTRPVATNETAAGRQLNRRVEIVISGDVIGVEISKPVAPKE